MPRLVPVPVLVLVFFSFSWSMSHRELWLARTGSSSGGLRRPLAALGLWPGMNWMGRKIKETKKQSGTGFRGGWRRTRSQRERDTTGHVSWVAQVTNAWQMHWLTLLMHVLVFYLGTAGLVLLLAAVQNSYIITLLCPWGQDHTAGHTGRLGRENDSKGRGLQFKTYHTKSVWDILKRHSFEL